MSNYTKTTNFATKDSLPSGDANKIVKGAEINTEFDNIATAVATKSNTASPTFTGTVTIPTLTLGATTITSTGAELNILDGVTSTTAELNILDGVTSTASELNILDGVTSTAAELNILDGVTSSTAELNILDGVTATASELNILDGVTSSTAELNILDGVTATATELNIMDGVTATTAELNYVDGVTSNIQTQLNAKVASLSDLSITASASELNIMDGVTATTAELNILDGVTSTASELNILDGVTSTAAELNLLDGVTATTAELNYVDGVTSNVQTQLDAKAPIASPTFTGTVTIPTADINAGTIDGTAIGASSASTGAFTTLTASGTFTASPSGGVATLGANGHITSKQSLDVATAGGRYIGSSNRGILGQLRIEQATTGADGGYIDFDTCANGSTSPTNRMRIDSSGNVNIGSTNSGVSGALDLSIGSTSSAGGVTLWSPTNSRHSLGFGDGYTGTDRYRGYVEYSHSDDSMRLGTSALERLRIDSSGNVGIGITSSLEKFTVANASSGIVGRFTNNTNQTLDLGVISGSGAAGGVYYNSANSGYHAFQVGGTEKMRLDSSGNVGIGTTSPSGSFVVSSSGAEGVEFFPNSFTNGNTIQHYDRSSSVYSSVKNIAADHRFNIGSTEAMRIDSSGKVGIGTTSPTANLHVRDTTDGTEANAHFKIEGAASTYTAHHWLDTNAYYIGQNSTVRAVRIYSSAESSGVNLAAGGTSWGTFSDERLKYDVEPVENAVESLSNLRTVKYRLKDVDSAEDKKKIGLMAQDLVGVLDEAIDPVKKTGDDTEYMSIKYTELVPVLVKAIQEQQTLIESLTARIAALEE